MTSKPNDKQDKITPVGVSRSRQAEEAMCYKCNKVCTERWAIDHNYFVCMTCGKLIEAPGK